MKTPSSNTPSSRIIRVCGMDPSLRNWGIAMGMYDMDSHKLTIGAVDTINPVLPTGKQVRQNSLDLEAACQLYKHAYEAAGTAQAVFVEVPVGSQSARAMVSYALCVGILGALRANGIPFFEVTPTEVKLIVAGEKTASKRSVITWAMEKHPEANWPTYKQHGNVVISSTKAEHQADAVAAIYAGMASNAFKQMLPFLAVQP